MLWLFGVTVLVRCGVWLICFVMRVVYRIVLVLSCSVCLVFIVYWRVGYCVVWSWLMFRCSVAFCWVVFGFVFRTGVVCLVRVACCWVLLWCGVFSIVLLRVCLGALLLCGVRIWCWVCLFGAYLLRAMLGCL